MNTDTIRQATYHLFKIILMNEYNDANKPYNNKMIRWRDTEDKALDLFFLLMGEV